MNIDPRNTDNPKDPSASSDGVCVRPLWRFLYLLVAPLTGWKRIKNAAYSSYSFARHLFFPLLALMALSRFALLIYDPEETLVHCLQMSISLFVAGFAGYYSIVALGRTFLPPVAREKIDTPFGKVYVMTCLSVLALAISILELVPGLGVIFIVVPIYASYLMVKGVRFLRVPRHEEMPVAILMTLLMLAVPMVIFFILEWLMPAAQTGTAAY